MEDEEEFRCAATQTDPISSSDDEEDLEELELTMDTVGELNGIDYHLEYEEITLKRSKNGKRLGLTLCYGNNDEYDTDIFVSEIEKGSIADNDGRIKVGDQILQVNRQTVNSRKEAITQFSMDNNEITIMLARPRLPDNDDSNDEDEEIANVTEADLHQIANSHRTGSTNNAALSPLPENDDGDGQLTENSGFEKDSGLSRATDSDPDLIGLSVPAQTSSQTGTSDRALEHELAFLRKEMETIRLECDRLLNKHNSAEKRVAQQVQQATNLMQTIDRLTAPQSPYRQILNSTGTSVTSSPIPQYFPQQPSNGSSQFSPHMGYERRSRHPITNPYHPSGNPHVSVGATIGINGRMRPLQHEETSSAYNTGGDSCRSTPLKGEYSHVIDTTTNTPPRRPIHLTTKERVIEPPLSPNSENQYHTIETPMSNATTVHFRPSGSIITTTNHPPPFPTTSIPKRDKIQPHQQQQQHPQIFYKPGDIMYTSPENLAETIALQQRLLRQAMVDQGHHHNKPGSSKNLQGHGMIHKQNEKIDPAQKYEWKVKRRSDGTCYITRKPLRNQLLKAREEQLNKERHGLSTDDDAASELKTGRFWSREERKRHLERAKEKKANKMQIAMQKVPINPSEQMIMQLSNRKQMRRSGRQLFDKFTTLQEFLAHGSRDPSTAPIGGILSVTTV